MSDDEELLFGLLGTQFNVDADIDTENRRQKLKRKAIDDEVTDEKGRALRFHGAFTGGFNAGYFNTVGSKEGFIPQQYVSQGRKQAGSKSNIRQYKPEDFMDEEDFGEHGIAPRMLTTKSVFNDDHVRKQFKQSLGQNSAIFDSEIIKDILVPQRLTIGMILLRKLGYTASHGVGDNDVTSDSEIDEIDEKKSERFQYKTEEVYHLVGQLNKFGLGYSGISHLDNSSNNVQLQQGVNFGHKTKRGIKGHAFGVGVEEEEEDLMDFYSGDNMSKYNFEIVEDEDKEMNFGWTAPKKLVHGAITEAGSISGFQLGRKRNNVSQLIYEPPKPSRFYIPIFPVRREKENARLSKSAERPRLMPSDESNSVFNLLSAQDRDKLLNLGQEVRVPRKTHSRWGNAPELAVHIEENPVFAELANTAKPVSNSFKPAEIPFTRKKESKKSWNLQMSLGMMFKSAGSSTETQDIDYCLNSITKKENRDLGDSEDSSKVMAARQDNYGFMTRSIVEWHPEKLLCKRFNIADPYPGSTFSGVPDQEDRGRASSPACSTVPVIEHPSIVYSVKPELETDSADPPKSESIPIDVPVTPVENSPPAPLEIKTTVLDVSNKPEMDLFKAVFADSDADFSSSDEEPEVVEVAEQKLDPAEEPMSIVSSLEQALNSLIGNANETSSSLAKPINLPPESMVNVYGPSIPPGFVPNSVPVESTYSTVNEIISKNIKPALQNSDDDNDDLYVFKEKSGIKKSKKHKKEKKPKKDKKKKTKKSK